jgi:hypothetical protein
VLPGGGSNGSSTRHCASVIDEDGYTRQGVLLPSVAAIAEPCEGHDKHEQAGKTGIGVPGRRDGLSNQPTYQELLHYPDISGRDTPRSPHTADMSPSFKPRS